MKTVSEFQNFYNAHLLASLKEMDRLRKKTLRKNFSTTLLFILLIIAMVAVALLLNRMIYGEFFSERRANLPLTIVLIISIVLFIYYLGRIKSNRRKYVSEFKNRIITEIIEFIEPGLKYSPTGFVGIEDFKKSKLFRRLPDSYRGDDLVTGTIDKTDIAFSEIHARYKVTEYDDDGGRKERWKKIFDGLFFMADFHKDFNGEYFVLADFAERAFGKQGKFFQKMNKRYGQLIELENIEFEKEFVVYGSDQIEARYILSATIMERLLNFKKRTDKKIRISFVKSLIFIAIPYRKKLFEPCYRKSVVNEKKTMQFFRDMELAIGIVEELNLNLRIWSKE